MANSSAARCFRIKLDHAKPAKAKDPKDYKHRRQAGAARRHPGQGDRALRLHPQFPRPRHAARPRGAAAGDRRQARKRGRKRDQENPRHRQGGARGQFPRRRRRRTNGPPSRRRATLKASWSKWEGLPEQAKLFEHVRATKVVQGPGDQQCRRHRGRDGARRARRNSAATYDFAIHTHGSIGPSCAVAEFKDGKLTSWSASQATHDLRKQLAQMLAHAGRERALHLSRGLRLLRPQRPRGRSGRRRAAGQGGGQAGARAMVARRRARLGPEGAADADGPARRAWMRPATSPPGSRSSSFRSRRRAASWCR